MQNWRQKVVTFLLHLRRNIARNQGRTLGLMLVVGLTLGIFLVLGQVSTSISAYSGQVVASVPNIITVAPANTSIGGGYFVGLAVGPTSTGLNSSMISTISRIANIQAIQRVYDQPLQLPAHHQHHQDPLLVVRRQTLESWLRTLPRK